MSVNVSLRSANLNDVMFLWYLRNQPDVYKYFKTAESVPLEQHINWIMPIVLHQGNKIILFIIENDAVPVGQIRLDCLDGKAQISISILNEFRGRGIAREALKSTIEKIKTQVEVNAIIAEIHEDNLSSVNLFTKSNFKFQGKDERWLKYALPL